MSVTEDGIFCNRKTRTPAFRHKYCIMVEVSNNKTNEFEAIYSVGQRLTARLAEIAWAKACGVGVLFVFFGFFFFAFCSLYSFILQVLRSTPVQHPETIGNSPWPNEMKWMSVRDKQALRGRRWDLFYWKMGSSATEKFARQHSGTTTALWSEFETMRQWACPFETGKLSVMEGGIARRGRWGPPWQKSLHVSVEAQILHYGRILRQQSQWACELKTGSSLPGSFSWHQSTVNKDVCFVFK